MYTPDGRRPNTVPPDKYFSLTSEQVAGMLDEQLRSFLDEYLGIRMPFDTPRSLLLSKLESVAVAARDY